MNKVAVAVDVEHDNGVLIEIGLTTIDLQHMCTIKSYSIPLKVDFDISTEIEELTGWSRKRLNKQGFSKEEVIRRVKKYCGIHRLLVTDMDNEIPFIEDRLGIRLGLSRLNISTLFKLMTNDYKDNKSLTSMCEHFNLELIQPLHRANVDSLNIANIFISLVEEMY